MRTTTKSARKVELKQQKQSIRVDGWLAIFDGDCATATVAKGDCDPLETCIEAFRIGFVHDQWLIRRLPVLIGATGFTVHPTRSHGYVEAPEAGYMLTLIDRGADVLVQNGRISIETAEALRAEARRRSKEKEWFGHSAHASVLARKAA